MSQSLPPLSGLPPTAGTAAAGAATYSDFKGLAALEHAPPDAPATLRAVSEQVEALFLQMMLKSMQDATEAQGGETGTESGNEASLYRDMFNKQVALTLSKRQDLGIARLFERQLGGKTAPSAPGAAGAPAGGAPLLHPEPATNRSGAGGGRSSGSTAASDVEAAHFVRQVLPTIRRAARGLGVDPVGMLAQAALETGWGRRMPRTADGSSSLNLFGVKASGEWTGARAVADTIEVTGAVASQRRTAFRAYGSIEESVNDFAGLLAGSPRYREALAVGGDARAYVDSIARSGYATDPEYGNKLNQLLNSGTLRSALELARL